MQVKPPVGVTVAVWTPRYDTVLAFEQSRLGLIAPEWVRDICVGAAGGSVMLSFNLGRHGAVFHLKKPPHQLESWLERWAERFADQWQRQTRNVVVGDWKALIVVGDLADEFRPKTYLNARFANYVDAGLFDTLPARVTQMDWAQFRDHVQGARALSL